MDALPFSLHEETQQLRDKYETQLQMGNPSPRLQFELACLLSCSPRKKDIREAIELFDELLDVGYNRTDCLFQSALAQLKTGDYVLAKRRVETLLRLVRKNFLRDRRREKGVDDALAFWQQGDAGEEEQKQRKGKKKKKENRKPRKVET